MYKFLILLAFVSCASTQNSKITPEPQNLTKENNSKLDVKNKIPEKKQEEVKTTKILLIPTDTAQYTSDVITNIAVEQIKNIEQKTTSKPEEVQVSKFVETKKETPKVEQKKAPIKGYKVQIAAFKEIDKAEQHKFLVQEKLVKGDISAPINITIANGFYKVVVGNFENREEAENLKNKLETISVKGFIIK